MHTEYEDQPESTVSAKATKGQTTQEAFTATATKESTIEEAFTAAIETAVTKSTGLPNKRKRPRK